MYGKRVDVNASRDETFQISLHFKQYFLSLKMTFCAFYFLSLFDHSNESFWAVLPCGAVYFAGQVGLTFY